MEEHQYKLALNHINKAIKNKENDSRFHRLKEQIFAALGKNREAQKEFLMAEKLQFEAL
jgi:Flp pilus assembly protein TadD